MTVSATSNVHWIPAFAGTTEGEDIVNSEDMTQVRCWFSDTYPTSLTTGKRS